MSVNWRCVKTHAAVFGAVLICGLRPPVFAELMLEKSSEAISPDPSVPLSVRVLKKRAFGFRPVSDYSVQTDPPGRVRVIASGDRFYLVSTFSTNGGAVSLIVRSRGESVTQSVSFLVRTADTDSDGYPDASELGNSQSFRDWFCAIAESQFYHPSDVWYDVKKDCAGLAEFAYREALKKHDRAWARGFKFLSDTAIPDDRKFYYPDVPFIGRRLFRVRPGPFDPAYVDRDFSVTAGPSALRAHSMKFVSRDARFLKKGDLIFFLHSDNMTMPSHAMIFIGNRAPSDIREGYLVYHTGPGPTNRGFVKKARLGELMRHPDPAWRPVPENERFLGVYRWKIID